MIVFIDYPFRCRTGKAAVVVMDWFHFYSPPSAQVSLDGFGVPALSYFALGNWLIVISCLHTWQLPSGLSSCFHGKRDTPSSALEKGIDRSRNSSDCCLRFMGDRQQLCSLFFSSVPIITVPHCTCLLYSRLRIEKTKPENPQMCSLQATRVVFLY